MKTKIHKKKLLPINKKYYYAWQIEEHKAVCRKHGKKYADRWFKGKFGR